MLCSCLCIHELSCLKFVFEDGVNFPCVGGGRRAGGDGKRRGGGKVFFGIQKPKFITFR